MHCGEATIDGGGVKTVEKYCYDDGIIPPSGPGGPSGGGSTGGGGGGGGPGSAPTLALQMHEMNCAASYGKYGPEPGVITTFADDWGWVIDKLGLKAETDMKAPPPPIAGYSWQKLDADTTNIGDPSMATTLYMPAYVDRGNTINTLAHEFSHQHNVLDEDEAEAIGNAAEDAYNADSGAKCGGL